MVRKLLLTCVLANAIAQCTEATTSLSWGGQYKHGTLLFPEPIDRANLFNKIPQGKIPIAIIRDALVGYLDVIPGRFSLYRTFRSVTPGNTPPTSQVALSKDGGQLAVGYGDGSIILRSSASGGLLHVLWSANASPAPLLAFSPDGKLLVSGHYFDNVRFWDTRSGKLLHILDASTNNAEAIAFNSAGTQLAVGYNDGNIRVWNVTSRQLLCTLGGSDEAKSLAFSPDGTQLVSGHKNGILHLWDIGSGSLLRTLTGHIHGISAVAFSPDGAKLASGSFDTTVCVWNLAPGELTDTLTGHGRVLAVIFIYDDIQFASDDGSIHLWNSTSRHLLTILDRQPQKLESAAFSPDGTLLASRFQKNNRVRLWLDYKKVLTEYFKKVDGTTGYEQLLFALVVARAKKEKQPLELAEVANYINAQLGGTQEQPVTNQAELIKIFLSMPPLVRGAFMRIFDLHMPMREYTKRAREDDDGGDEPAGSASRRRLDEDVYPATSMP